MGFVRGDHEPFTHDKLSCMGAVGIAPAVGNGLPVALVLFEAIIGWDDAGGHFRPCAILWGEQNARADRGVCGRRAIAVFAGRRANRWLGSGRLARALYRASRP